MGTRAQNVRKTPPLSLQKKGDSRRAHRQGGRRARIKIECHQRLQTHQIPTGERPHRQKKRGCGRKLDCSQTSKKTGTLEPVAGTKARGGHSENEEQPFAITPKSSGPTAGLLGRKQKVEKGRCEVRGQPTVGGKRQT